MIEENSTVIVNLHSPKEQFWGILKSITPMGVTLMAINIKSFDDWINQVARKGEQSIGLVTVFFPMQRVERVFKDEDVGMVKSLASQFLAKVGISIEEYLESDRDIHTAPVTH